MDRSIWTEEIIATAKLLCGGWSRPSFGRPIGPHDPTVFDKYASALDHQFDNLALAMFGLMDDDLRKHANFYKQRPLGGEMTSCRPIFDAMRHISQLNQPPWFAGGFNVIGREPDYDFWARMKTWSLDEAVAISIGFEPAGKIAVAAGAPAFTKDVVNFYHRRRKLIENNFFPFSDKTIQALQPSPGQFCKWAISVRLEAPTELFQAVANLYDIPMPDLVTKETVIEEPALDPRERTSLLTLILLLAKKAYAFDPEKERSDVPNRIQSDLNLMGMDLHPQTIRRYLKAAGSIRRKGADDE